MREDFLHFVWRFKKLNLAELKTTDGLTVEVLNFGSYNTLSGPDFFNAMVVIGGQQWAGNIEMHLNSSDWYAHHHEKDAHYNNVILHVVWNHDVEVFNSNKQKLPVLVLKDYVDNGLISNYHKLLLYKYKFINCETEIGKLDGFLIQNWQERLYIERLEEKSVLIFELLAQTKNNWEEVLFKLLMKNFGGNINGPSFLEVANSFEFSVFQKVNHDLVLSEALLFGQAGLLTSEAPSAYESLLMQQYHFLQSKFGFKKPAASPPQFFKLRPPNFPTVRLSQIAMLFGKNPRLFSELMQCKAPIAMKEILRTRTTEFWETHYTFTKLHPAKSKITPNAFLELIIINTVLPLQFCYRKRSGTNDVEGLLSMAAGLLPEKNTITNNFGKLKLPDDSALQSQAWLQLYKHYCTKNRCLHCAIGAKLIRG